jgi:hypothetical protein
MKNVGLALAAGVLGLYAAVAAPQLPDNVILFFDSYIGRFLFVFLIALSATTDIQVGLVVAIGYLFMFLLADRYIASEQFAPSCSRGSTEHFAGEQQQQQQQLDSTSQQSLDTAVCQWVKSLNDKHEPTRANVEKMNASEAIQKYAANIRILAKDLTDFDIKKIANDPQYHYKTKTIKGICQ